MKQITTAKSIILLCIAFLCIAVMNCNPVDNNQEIITGYVVSIADGDTFTLLTSQKKQLRIRLYGIDCPEKAQAYGTVAKQELSRLIFNTTVHAHKTGIDKYKRTLAIVYDEQHNCINEEMLKMGLAWHYSYYDNNVKWQQLEDKAREQKLGLWADANAIPPWQWRREKRLH